MKLLKLILILILVTEFYSCEKKKYPESQVIENSTVYYSDLIIDSKPVLLQAGVNGYYMHSSYQLDSNFVYNFIGELKIKDCNNCNNSLKIQINNSKISIAGEPSLTDTTFRPAKYPILSGNPVARYLVKFQSLNTNNIGYDWVLDDGVTYNGQSISKVFPKSGKYNVCLTTKSANNCVSRICNTEKIDLSSNSCKVRITASETGLNTLVFSNVVTGGNSPYQYLWNFGDGSTSNKNSVSHNYKYRGAYPITLRVIDALGDTAYAKYNAKTLSDSSSCTANYSITSIQSLPPDPALSHIIISWTDSNGITYTSNNPSQSFDSFFEILAVSEGEKNEKNQSTKKITAKFKCQLFNGTKVITVNEAKVVISVAY